MDGLEPGRRTGGNYGWNLKEGSFLYDKANQLSIQVDTNGAFAAERIAERTLAEEQHRLHEREKRMKSAQEGLERAQRAREEGRKDLEEIVELKSRLEKKKK